MTSSVETADSRKPATCAVFFDGSCPLCSSEIAMYQKLPARNPLRWIDVSAADYQPPAGTTTTQLMQRLHVSTDNGELLSGARAFVYIWAQLPGWRHLARIALIPGMVPLMEGGYRIFLVFRPWTQRFYRRWQSTH